eukprot:177890_1
MTFDINSYESEYIDYYYIYDNIQSIDNIIGGYRLLTGGTPQLYSINVYGFWHSENAFGNQQAVLNCAQQYRNKKYPVDNIVQDYYYWGNANDWGPQWDPNKYPNPKQMVNELHSMNFKFMVSVWPKYGSNTTFYKYCLKNNYLLNPPGGWLNAYQHDAADLYYYYINQSMFSIGVDYIWADSTEPDNFPNHNKKFVGNVPNDISNNTLINLSGNVLVNPYSIYVIKSLYDGYSRDYPNKRIFSLTRSGFGGQEKYGSAVWTGDISSGSQANDWDVLRRQIAASINYPFSGNNYWANDIGGFYRYCNGTNGEMSIANCNKNINYHRLMIRWFQFGVFIPLYRVHGYGNTAPYAFGDIAENYTLIITNLRYRLLPYIYTLAYMVRYKNYSMQRGLMFDFPNDPNINFIANSYSQFMFGMNLLIAPVFNDDNITSVYFPKNDASTKHIWWNFWTGEYQLAGATVHINVPLYEIPIYVKSGSILILGPIVQYSNEKKWDKLEIRIYKGDNGEFTLFEDDFFTRNSVENNKYTLISFTWNESSQQLTIGDRIGSFDTMIPQRTFDIILVKGGHGVGVNVTTNPDKSVNYNGKSVIVNL